MVLEIERTCFVHYAHLHFNVLNRLLMSEAEGLPYVFDATFVRGTTTAGSAFGDAPTRPGRSRNIARALPLNGTMIEFEHD